MSASPELRRYLDPTTLAKVHSLELRARLIVEGLMSGMHRSPFQGSSVEFAQHRQYSPGDDVRHLDWRVYGRSNRLYIKQYQEETNLPLMLVVDASESMGFGNAVRPRDQAGLKWTKFDHAVSIAAALAYLAIHQQDAVGLSIFDQTLSRYIKPSMSAAQWKLVIEELTHIPKWNKTDTGKVFEQLSEKLSHRSLVIIVSDFFDDIDSITRGLKRLRYRKHDIALIQVLDHDEIDFPFDDVTLFKGLEEAGQLLTEPRSLRDAYQAELKKQTDALAKSCRSMGVEFTRFDSSEPIDAKLADFLAR
ncbi:MAG TPA: DUF58 domain-containing protein, partial [Tepidisphaeraceae bacterium]|nr:DUF58 domain-containing protein [Tepidisphaeraceae bacterium]